MKEETNDPGASPVADAATIPKAQPQPVARRVRLWFMGHPIPAKFFGDWGALIAAPLNLGLWLAFASWFLYKAFRKR